MFDLIDDLNPDKWEDKGSPPDDLESIRKYFFLNHPHPAFTRS